jgi:hypothetical protein
MTLLWLNQSRIAVARSYKPVTGAKESSGTEEEESPPLDTATKQRLMNTKYDFM